MIKHDYYKINKIRGGEFRFVLSVGPIDYFEYTLSKEQIIQNICEDAFYSNDEKLRKIDEIERTEKFVVGYTKQIEETPFVRYISIPNQCSSDMDLVAIARISNNGTGFVYSNDPYYLQYVKSIKH